MQMPKDSSLFTKITWLDSTSRDFGTIPEGQKLEVAYRFLNSGDKATDHCAGSAKLWLYGGGTA